MRHRGLTLGMLAPCLMLAILCGWSGAAVAQGPYGDFDIDNATLTVAVLPLQAEIRLDGTVLGSAQDLLARALSMLPGDHVVEIWAPGYLPRMVRVLGTPNWASHVRLELVPDRR